MKRTLTIALMPVLALAVAWYSLIWQPKSTQASDLTNQLTETQAQLTQIRSKLSAASNAPLDPLIVTDRLQSDRLAIPAESDVGGFLSATTDAANAAGVTLVETTPQTPTPAAGAATSVAPAAAGATPAGAAGSGTVVIPVRQVVRGEHSRVLDYVSRLEGLPRLVVIDKLNITSETAGSDSVSLDLRIFSLAL